MPCREVGGPFLEKNLHLCGDSESVEDITVDVRGPGRGKGGKRGNPSMSMYTRGGNRSGGSIGSGECPEVVREKCIAGCPSDVILFKLI